MTETSWASTRTRHGTPSGWTKHKRMGEDPCPACYTAKSEYDERRKSAPDEVRKSRIAARAQMKAYGELARKYHDEYQISYQAWKERLTEEEEMGK